MTSAYRKLAAVWHPDKPSRADPADAQKAEERFTSIQRAHATLSDARQRKMYDLDRVALRLEQPQRKRSVVAGPSSPSSRMLGDVARANPRVHVRVHRPVVSIGRARRARASGASEDDRGPKPRVARARARARVARPRLDDDGTVRSPSASTSTSASSTTRGTALTEEEKSARLEALRLRDLRLQRRAFGRRPRVRVRTRRDTRGAENQERDRRPGRRRRPRPRDAAARARGVALRVLQRPLKQRSPSGTAFADLLRSGASPTPDQIWEMVESFESGGEEWARKTEDALAYLETLSRD